ncbi:tetraacyldisaccharide 4'-kinase [Candidatus Chlamydia sanziniae]|nr:tetraacyldisaccharide 4'-kinase [Candidatus Chlamydia sanziniae]
MRRQFPSALFMLYRRLTVSMSFGHIFGLGWLSRILSGIFACVVKFRSKFPFSSPVRVRSSIVSVGNIVLGGTGKTPFVLWLVEALRTRGYSCAVLSRGYKGRCSRKATCVVVDPRVHSAAYVGDEPLLMAKKLPQGSVWVNKDRRMSALRAAEHFDFLLLDDGLQYGKLQKDIEIAVVNGSDPLGSGAFFPTGRLRDFPSRLKTVDAIVINGESSVESQRLLKNFSQAPQFFVRPYLASVVWMHNGEQISVEELHNRGVGVFCGLGFPQGFFTMLKQAGVRILGTYLLPDHSGITKKELYYFCQKMASRQAQGVLCTEKDSVKLGDMSGESGWLPIGKVEMRFAICEDHALSLLNIIDQTHKSRGN